jgi:hypothetical protein
MCYVQPTERAYVEAVVEHLGHLATADCWQLNQSHRGKLGGILY